MGGKRSGRRYIVAAIVTGLLMAGGPAQASAERVVLRQQRWLASERSGGLVSDRDTWSPSEPAGRIAAGDGELRAAADVNGGVSFSGALDGALDALTVDLHVVKPVANRHMFVAEVIVDGDVLYRSSSAETATLLPTAPGHAGRQLRVAFTDLRIAGDAVAHHVVTLRLVPAGVTATAAYAWGAADAPSHVVANPSTIDVGPGGYLALRSQRS